MSGNDKDHPPLLSPTHGMMMLTKVGEGFRGTPPF